MYLNVRHQSPPRLMSWMWLPVKSPKVTGDWETERWLGVDSLLQLLEELVSESDESSEDEDDSRRLQDVSLDLERPRLAILYAVEEQVIGVVFAVATGLYTSRWQQAVVRQRSES